MTYKYSTLIKAINVLVDFSLLTCCFLLAGYMSDKNESLVFRFDSHHQLNMLLFNLCWFFFASVIELYSNVIKRSADETARSTVAALIMYSVLCTFLVLTFPQLALSIDFTILFILLFSVVLIIWKTWFLLFRKSRRRFWIESKSIILLGATRAGLELYHHITANPYLGYTIVGVFDDQYVSSDENDPPVIGRVDECLAYAKDHGIAEIYCALPTNECDRIRSLMNDADRLMIRMRLVPDLSNILHKNVMLEVYGNMPVLTARQEPLENKTNEIIKRAFDILFSLGAILFILSWVTPIVAILIKLDSKGPVFFRQLRSGRNNKPFYCLKFRSMSLNKDCDRLQASRGDSRITKVGEILRMYSIDELPQFINVLLGDMSVVGPRPHMLKHTKDYSLVIGNYMVRQFLTPGITGWAQVNGFRGEIKGTSSMSKRVDADLWYLENWSFFLDLKIVFLTMLQAFRKNENAF